MTFLETSDVICIEGFSEPLYDEALTWVDEARFVYFLTSENKKSSHPRILIFHLETPLLYEPMVKKMAWLSVLKKTQVIGSQGFSDLFSRLHLAAGLILSEKADWHVSIVNNAKANNAEHRDGLLLKGVFTNIPAIIVGGGPSLRKNGHLLKLFKDKALIFSGGAALNQIDVEPHFAAQIDPIAPKQIIKAPLCYQARMNPEHEVHGGKILFPDSSSDLINWFYSQEEGFDGGWTVGNFMAAVASFMGCSPILCVGMDYCYEAGDKYASGEGEAASNLIKVGDVETQADWIMAAEWMKGVKGDLINATEGGILDLPKASLESFLTKFKPLDPLVHQALEKSPLKAPSERFIDWQIQDIVNEKLLDPLWQVWKPVFEREINQDLELHKKLFFQSVMEAHGILRGDEVFHFAPRQSPGFETREEGGSIEEIHPPSSRAQSRELSRWSKTENLNAPQYKISHYPDGKIRTIERILEGRFHGETLLYWPNGNLKRRCLFEHGVRHGTDEIWSEEGQLVSKEDFRFGKLI